MKKRLITILSLIMAFVLCFALVACGGDNETPSGQEPGGTEDEKTMSISLGDALTAVDDALSSSYVGSAKYTLSTKKNKPYSESYTLDKRGNKVKVTIDEEEVIVDLDTGYSYGKSQNGYAFKQSVSADIAEYVKYVLSNVSKDAKAKSITAQYDKDTKTATYVVDVAKDVNKYLEPFQSAYKNDKKYGEMLDDYCELLFNKKFDDLYKTFEDYIKDSKNTVGTVFEALKGYGLDVEAILKSTIDMPEDQIKIVKARKLNEVVAGAYKFVKSKMSGNVAPTAEEDIGYGQTDDDDYDQPSGDGMESVLMGAVQAMFFEEVSEADVQAGLQGISSLLTVAKSVSVKTWIDETLKNDKSMADLYTVITKEVKLTAASVTLTVKYDDDKKITDVKFDAFASHNYTGEAAEGSILADNDYRVVAELSIDKSKASAAEFDIKIIEGYDYKDIVSKIVYSLDGKDVYVYFETAGNEVTVDSIVLYKSVAGEEMEPVENAQNAVTFDAEKSMFKFDGAVVKAALKDANPGDSLIANVKYVGDENSYPVVLTYLNADPQAMIKYIMTITAQMGSNSEGPSEQA